MLTNREWVSSRRITSIVQLVTVIGQTRIQLHDVVALFQMIRRDETAKFKDLPGKSRQRRIVSHAHCLTVCEKTRSHHETQPRIRGKRDVKLPW